MVLMVDYSHTQNLKNKQEAAVFPVFFRKMHHCKQSCAGGSLKCPGVPVFPVLLFVLSRGTVSSFLLLGQDLLQWD